MTARKVTIPAANEPVIMSDGSMNPNWYLFFKFIETLQPLSDIENPAFTVPAITVGNTTTAVTNRSVSVDNGGLTGVDTGVLGVGTVSNPQQNGWTTLMNVVNAYSTNHTNHKNAADALNTRMRAAETKLNAIIADLATRFP